MIFIQRIVFNRTEGGVVRIDDVTARARMEAMMVQTEKMMSVGGLAAGMAHEINNPLGAMAQSAQNILRRISTDLPANLDMAAQCGVELAAVRCFLERRRIIEFLEGIRSAGDKAAEIVENMLHFSRKSETHKEAVDLTELLDKAVSLAAHDFDLKKSTIFEGFISAVGLLFYHYQQPWRYPGGRFGAGKGNTFYDTPAPDARVRIGSFGGLRKQSVGQVAGGCRLKDKNFSFAVLYKGL
jgi:signal transduction histidine kinase